MLLLRKTLVIIVLLFGVQSYAQEYDGLKGYGVYHQYDKSYISPTLRGKHSISLGAIGALSSPIGKSDGADSLNQSGASLNTSIGFHVGYNYLIMKKRKRIFGGLEEYRDEVKSGFGVHLSFLTKGEFFFMANYFNPFFSLKGKALSFYFINEYGIGVHKPKMEEDEIADGLKLNLSLEAIRIRLGKSHFNLHLTVNYHANNKLFGKERIKMGFTAGLRYYIYKE